MLYFSIENARADCDIGCEAGCGLTVSWSDHSRIILGSAPHCINDVSPVFEKFCGNSSIW